MAEAGDYVVHVERSGLPMTRTSKIVDKDKLNEVNALIEAGKMRIALPIVGCQQKTSQGEVGELQRRILEAEGVEPYSFKIPDMHEVTGKGEVRAVISPIRSLKFESVLPDADNAKKRQAELDFTLLRGSYATVLLREIMKPKNLINAGF